MARKKREEEPMDTDGWLATYADLVTLLLCFFVLLFAFSEIDVQKFSQFMNSFQGSTGVLDSGVSIDPDAMLTENDDTDETAKELEGIAKDIQEYLESQGYSEKVIIEYNNKYVKLSFLDGILFGSGEAIVKNDAVDVLDTVGVKLLEYKNNKIKIEGHTDTVPMNSAKYPNNWYLSAARSINVAEYYINKKGIDPQRLSAEGFGEYVPVATNDTPEGRRKNRRIEIKILNSASSGDHFEDEE